MTVISRLGNWSLRIKRLFSRCWFLYRFQASVLPFMFVALLLLFLLLQNEPYLLCILQARMMVPLRLIILSWSFLFRMTRNTVPVSYPYCPRCSHFWFIPSFWWSTSSGSLLRKGVWKINLEESWISVMFLFHSSPDWCFMGKSREELIWLQNLRLFLHCQIVSGFVAQWYWNIFL